MFCTKAGGLVLFVSLFFSSLPLRSLFKLPFYYYFFAIIYCSCTLLRVIFGVPYFCLFERFRWGEGRLCAILFYHVHL